MEKRKLWTAQTQVDIDELDRSGVTYVRNEYVAAKYGDSAWIFQAAYREMGRIMAGRIPKPEKAQSPVWMFSDPKWAYGGPGTYLLQLEVPASELVLFDLRDWSRVLNLELLGTEAEKKAFEKEMQCQGVTASYELFEKPFYPLLKRKVTESWEKHLISASPDPDHLQAAAWCLKKEWIVRIQAFSGQI